ncbi:tRNA (adenosine(37)-N6)-threonylcarbamoyltransferase complex dimerization subunit type 1 TsaB [Spiroplasma endosymbiont of Crioceris asparagi]|uniref:tRNA (adenosine(37)-N6)-threonylcarbamoyltransferase complex dimerization subunit type 1 TsaB n=1 Tax=Spiroplasma endosymbiont of Crioceris asparagi TaxID=3066286 RepID=UPI0030CD150E
MNNLFIDTTNFKVILILEKDNEVLDKLFLENEKRISDHISNTINQLLKKHNLTLKDLNNIYLAKGPGSYTGVRVGVAFSKTLMILNKKIKVFSISSLVFQAGVNKVISTLDAKGEKVYFGIYENGKNLIPDQILEFSQFEMIAQKFANFEIVKDYQNIDFEKNYFDLKNNNSFIEEKDIKTFNPIYIKSFI